MNKENKIHAVDQRTNLNNKQKMYRLVSYKSDMTKFEVIDHNANQQTI